MLQRQQQPAVGRCAMHWPSWVCVVQRGWPGLCCATGWLDCCVVQVCVCGCVCLCVCVPVCVHMCGCA